MAINAMIPMQGQVADPLNALASGYKLGNTIRQQPMVDQMNQQKLQAGQMNLDSAKLKMQEAAKDARVKSAVMGAAELQSAPVEQWANILQDRINGAARYGYDADTEKEALQILQTKGPEALKGQVDGLVKFGGAMGLLGARKGTYGALTPAIGPDGKPVYIQSDPSGGQPNVVQGYAPMPTAADQAAALQAQQNAAMARLLSGGVGGQGGPIPSPNAPAGSTNPFAGMSIDDISKLPPEIQKKAFESMIDPKTKDSQEQQAKKAEFQARAATLLGDLIGMPSAVKSAVGTIDSMTPTIMPATAEAENKIAQLRSILTADNLKLMTGVLSETDMKVLREISAGQLDTKRDQNAFLRDLNTLYEKLSGMSGKVQRNNSASGNQSSTNQFTSSTGIQFTVE